MQTTFRGMLGSVRFVRARQIRWTMAYWARAFGLLPNSGKWMERITFVYIYVISIALLTPTLLSLLNGLYVTETKVAPAARFQALNTTLPTIIAVASVLLIGLPWRAWMLRLTFGDMVYLAPSPFDRRVLVLWRFIEVCIFIGVIGFIPFTLLAPAFGSIEAAHVLPVIFRGITALALWFAPMLAVGWVISLQEYQHDGQSGVIRWLTRVAFAGAAVALFALGSELLLWPGRMVMAIASGDSTVWYGWFLLIGWAALGGFAVWRVGRGLSLTRAAERAETFARIQQLGFMIFVDRQLLGSIIAETRANQSRAVGTLPRATGIWTIAARAFIFYRRQYGQAVQLVAVGLAFGAGLLLFNPADPILTIFYAVILVVVVAPMMARVFRHDLDVPFITQFNLHPVTSQIVVAAILPALLVLIGVLPVLIAFWPLVPRGGLGLVPAVWVLSVFGHFEAIGKGGRPAARSIFTVIMGAAALLVLVWNVSQVGRDPLLAALSGAAIAGLLTFVLLFVAEIRRNGLNAAQMATPATK